MRHRTEMVTTTFVDSQEEESESDDSGEDWKPVSSNRNGKKRNKKGKSRVGQKRKLSGGSGGSQRNAKRREYDDTDEDEDDVDEEDDFDEFEYESDSPPPRRTSTQAATPSATRTTAPAVTATPTTTTLTTAPKPTPSPPPQPKPIPTTTASKHAATTTKAVDEEPATSQNLLQKANAKGSGLQPRNLVGNFNLFVYKKDLDPDYKTNKHLCLWRRDGTNLLQKFIRVKTDSNDEFIFTSSSVYSSWDNRRRKDFATLPVKFLEENTRRVIIVNLKGFHELAGQEIARKADKENRKNENPSDVDEDDDEDDDDDGDEDEEEDEIFDYEDEDDDEDDDNDGEDDDQDADDDDTDVDDDPQSDDDDDEPLVGARRVSNVSVPKLPTAETNKKTTKTNRN